MATRWLALLIVLLAPAAVEAHESAHETIFAGERERPLAKTKQTKQTKKKKKPRKVPVARAGDRASGDPVSHPQAQPNRAPAAEAKDDTVAPRVPGTPADEIEAHVDEVVPDTKVTSRWRDDSAGHREDRAVDIRRADFVTAAELARTTGPDHTVILEHVNGDGTQTDYYFKGDSPKPVKEVTHEQTATETHIHVQKDPKSAKGDVANGDKHKRDKNKGKAKKHRPDRGDRDWKLERIDAGDGATDGMKDVSSIA